MKQYDIFGKVHDMDDDGKYTKKVQSPVYEIKGDKPHVLELYDKTKSDRMISRINRAEIPEDIRKFLTLAAGRHTVFNYDRIAEYYAHAPKEVQSLMEESALIIIDFKKAIQLGYVKLSEDIVQEYLRQEGDEE